jgi:predicted DNA-binding ArsR family transcriptional regulator
LAITIVFLKQVDPNSTVTLTWKAPRDGKIVSIDFTFYYTKNLLKVYVTLDTTLNVITYATGSEEYVALHEKSVTLYCDKQFQKGDTITVKAINEDTDPNGKHWLTAFVNVELL